MHDEKFKGLIAAIAEARKSGAGMIIVPSPQTLGDNYAELIENLNRIAAAGLSLQIVPPEFKKNPFDLSRN